MREKPPSITDPQPAFVRRVADGIELRIKVIPGASRVHIVGVLGDRLKVKVTAAPEQGKANRAVLDLMARWLGVADIEIVSGHGRAEKTVKITGWSCLTEEHLKKLK